MAKKRKLKIMVSSTVYGSQDILDQIAAVLRQQFGYDVIMSKEGSVYVPVAFTSNPEGACLQAVNDCDLFFGIIFPRYGSGITHKEFKEAVKIDKPRWFVAHEKIEYLRKLFEPYLLNEEKARTDFEIKKNSVLDSIKVVDMYNDVRHNWVQSFTNPGELLFFIEQQFKDHERRLNELEP
ncbi:MAG: hypothetical protein C0424_05190 [Sphingobacteriaceae bacterium]|nr:hypothetical protein [Sphingobacteriaceae bacterium]